MTGADMGTRRHGQSGRTLLEIMIALAIGAVLTGAVLIAVSGAGLSGRQQDAQAALTENGQVALGVLGGPLRMAGYWQPASEIPSVDAPPDGRPMLRGCANGFAVPAADWDDLACGTAGRGAVAVRYQAGETGTTMATDCAGRDVTVAGQTTISDRFFIVATGTPTGNPALYCQPTTGGDPVMLIDNVESMALRYGTSPINTGALANRAFDAPALQGRTARYRTAGELATDCGPGAIPDNSWCAVTAVQVCVLMRSTDSVTDANGAAYIDCDGTLQTPADRRLRRAVTTTVNLRNRTALPTGPAS